MIRKEFERLVAQEFPKAIPEKFRKRIENVAILVEDRPSEETRRGEGLERDETLLGYYRGVPLAARGVDYGVGPTLPDTITLYQIPIEEAAGNDLDAIRRVVRETVWHEVAHHFGFNEEAVRKKERQRRKT